MENQEDTQTVIKKEQLDIQAFQLASGIEIVGIVLAQEGASIFVNKPATLIRINEKTEDDFRQYHFLINSYDFASNHMIQIQIPSIQLSFRPDKELFDEYIEFLEDEFPEAFVVVKVDDEGTASSGKDGEKILDVKKVVKTRNEKNNGEKIE